eukprot:10168494-Alexandrium_andersonii.AAC.1
MSRMGARSPHVAFAARRLGHVPLSSNGRANPAAWRPSSSFCVFSAEVTMSLAARCFNANCSSSLSGTLAGLCSRVPPCGRRLRALTILGSSRGQFAPTPVRPSASRRLRMAASNVAISFALASPTGLTRCGIPWSRRSWANAPVHSSPPSVVSSWGRPAAFSIS